MKPSIVLVVVLFSASLPLAVQAQWAVSPHIVISVPENEFANVEGTGGGFGVKVVRTTGGLGGHLGLRGDFAFLTFGKERAFDPFLGINVELRNEGFRLTFGPEYKIGNRSFKVYAGTSGGLYYFRLNVTSQFFNQVGQSRSFFESKENNWALGWNIGGGIQYDIGLGPWLDIGFEYQTMFNLPQSTEEENGAGSVPDITAHEYTIKFGVIFFLGR
ncbi:MAG: hypothetical protein ACE5IY_12765 [bacterium]